jgi:hypothetical protein
VYVLPSTESSKKKGKDTLNNKCTVLISVKINCEALDKFAKEINAPCTLTNTDLSTFNKTDFAQDKQRFFNKFDACERLEIIEEFLERELDFDYYMGSQIID